MGIYRCSRCDTMKDSDYGCTADPNDELGLMCEDCAGDLEELTFAEPPGSITFTAEQQAFIKKAEDNEI
jgi:hypothetical protein